jgi:hypothetical protein
VFPTRSSGRRRRSASAASPRLWPSAWKPASSVVLALALAVAGCGGSAGDAREQNAPKLPRALGTQDADAARAQAEELLAEIEAAIDAGDVPRALAADLRAGAERLLDLIGDAAPAPAPPQPGKAKDKGPGKAKGHEKKPKKPPKPKPGETETTTGPTDTTGPGETDTTGTTP